MVKQSRNYDDCRVTLVRKIQKILKFSKYYVGSEDFCNISFGDCPSQHEARDYSECTVKLLRSPSVRVCNAASLRLSSLFTVPYSMNNSMAYFQPFY